MAHQANSFAFIGGLDLVTPAIKKSPGSLIAGENYEPVITGGYRRILGFERYSGLPRPSKAAYYIINFVAGRAGISIGSVVTGLVSGVTSTVLDVVLVSGSWDDGNAVGFLAVYKASGVYADDEALQFRESTVAITNGISLEAGGDDDARHELYMRAARETTRSEIAGLPGSGIIRGGATLKGINYALRDSEDGTECVLYGSSPSGWQQVDLGYWIGFTLGSDEFLPGEVVTDGTATAIIVAVVMESGDWGTDDTAGRLYVKSVVGSFAAAALSSASGNATGTGAQNVNTLLPGGRFEIKLSNFGGGTDTLAMWGVDGVNRGFMFDGVGFAFIHTGMPVDAPEHVHIHKKHLFYSFDSSVQHSAPGNPFIWSAVFGAAEIGTGDRVVAFTGEPGGVLGIFNRQSTSLLYGDDITNWQLSEYDPDAGGLEWTFQQMRQTTFIDDRGISTLSPVQEHGDFKAGTLSEIVDPIIQSLKYKSLSSVRIRSKDQYRVFFDDNAGLIVTIGSDGRAIFTTITFDRPVRTTWSGDDVNGEEVIFFGSDDGFVYQMESGQSFDGAMIPYSMRHAFASLGSPRQKKRFFNAVIELDAITPPPLGYAADYSYGANIKPLPVLSDIDSANISTGGVVWGSGAKFGEFIWGGQLVGETTARLKGSGNNISLLIIGESNYEEPHTIHGITYNFSGRGLKYG